MSRVPDLEITPDGPAYEGRLLVRPEEERRYDPRRIVRDALAEPPVTATADDTEDAEEQARLAEEAARVRPGQKYLVTGGSAHPRRVLIESLPEDDPRRLAAYVPPSTPDNETASS